MLALLFLSFIFKLNMQYCSAQILNYLLTALAQFVFVGI